MPAVFSLKMGVEREFPAENLKGFFLWIELHSQQSIISKYNHQYQGSLMGKEAVLLI